MSPVMDNQLHVARETTYGTPVTPTRSYEALSDANKRVQEYLESNGMRAGMQATRSDRRRVINKGAEGEIEVDFQNKGMGVLLRAAIGSSASALVSGTTYLQTYNSTAGGPDGESLTVQMGRAPTIGTTVLPFTYHGGKVTEWELTQALDEMLKFKISLDYEDEEAATVLAAAAYAAAVSPFAWPDCVVSVDGGALEVKEFKLTGENGLETDRRFLRGSVLKKEPMRKEAPTYEGELSGEFQDLSAYNRFITGAIVPIVATWTGDLIETGQSYTLTVTLAACQFTGDTPQVSLDDLPEQAMPFKVLWNGTNPAVAITYKTTDTTY